MGKREDHAKRSKTVPARTPKKRTLINGEKLTELMLELEDFRRKHKLLPVEYEFLLGKTLEIMKECNKEAIVMAKEIERRRVIEEAIKRNQLVIQESEKNEGPAKYVS